MLENNIKGRINFYKSALRLNNIKIVMTEKTLNKLKKELKLDTEFTDGMTLFGIPLEINNNIATDYYITEIL